MRHFKKKQTYQTNQKKNLQNQLYGYALEKISVCNFPDDHHPAPTFTPPELPKRVHVRGLTAADNGILYNLFTL
jgi:hypothetical protein